jgi:serine/threonine protein phosphatase PrpC
MSDQMSASYAVKTSFLCNIGCHRQKNEDAINYVQPADKFALQEKGILAIIADGMGGYQGGEIASQMAVELISQAYYNHAGDDPIQALLKGFVFANQAIYEKALSEPSLRGMGTTCTALVIREGNACFAHVGDSRLYRLRNGELELLTLDHTLVRELVAGGLITAEQAHNHPDRSVITRSLGPHPQVSVDTSETLFPIQLGDVYLLCSDGLHDLVGDGDIRQAISLNTPHVATEYLISLAKQRGGYDNISIGVLAVGEPDTGDKQAAVTREAEL